MKKEIEILAPASGKVKELSKVKDPVFAGEMVGKGFAITPTKMTKNIKSPISKGKIKLAFEGGHAYGIIFKKIEILIHIGIETVNLKGKGFNSKVSVGEKINSNTILTDVNMGIIKDNAVSTDIMVLITNETLGDYKIERVAKTSVNVGEVLFKLVK